MRSYVIFMLAVFVLVFCFAGSTYAAAYDKCIACPAVKGSAYAATTATIVWPAPVGPLGHSPIRCQEHKSLFLLPRNRPTCTVQKVKQAEHVTVVKTKHAHSWRSKCGRRGLHRFFARCRMSEWRPFARLRARRHH